MDETALDAVRIRLDRWKRQLIDLTRRNRLLNYRATKVSTIEVVDELPQQILRQLLAGESFRFDPIPDPEEDGSQQPELSESREGAGSSSGRETGGELVGNAEEDGPGDRSVVGSSGDEDDDDGPPSVHQRIKRRGEAVRRTEGAELEKHHTDDRLQTPHYEKRLSRNLLRIYRASESSMEEKGVNTLFLALGMLKWYEDRNSDVVNRAPVLLVPVTLTRKDASSPFKLVLGEEEPVLNPALVEKLRLEFQIQLPALPELSEDLNIDDIFFGVQEAVSGFARWEVTNDVALGLFSFLKFIMYRDIEENEDLYLEHEVIQGLSGAGDVDPIAGLPPEVAEADLNEEMAPWNSVQILDADSSQQRAMLAVKKGHHLVIEGPPGTGKSQTISNLIADALADGKSVLFVSEKMAALEVVQSRLEDAGLGAFCLELHSHKTAKTNVVRDLARSLDTEPLEVGPTDRKKLKRLEALSHKLNQYAESLHGPVEPLKLSPFRAIEELAEVQATPLLPASIPDVSEVDEEAPDGAIETVREVASAWALTGPPSSHPLRGIGLTHSTRTIRDDLNRSANAAEEAVSDLMSTSEALADEVGFERPRAFGDVELLLDGSGTLMRSPGAEESILRNSHWNELSSDVKELLESGKKYQSLREHLAGRIRDRALEDDLQRELEDLEHHLQSVFRFIRPAYWRLRSELKKCLNPEFKPERGAHGILSELKRAQHCRRLRHAIQAKDEVGRELFGRRWEGPSSDWEDLSDFAEWVVEVRHYALKEALTRRGFEVAAGDALQEDKIQDLRRATRERLEECRDALREVVDAGQVAQETAGITVAASAEMREVRHRLREVQDALGELRNWTNLQRALRASEGGPAEDFLDRALEEEPDPSTLKPAFQRIFYREWLEYALEKRPVLSEFRPDIHEDRIEDFRELDKLSERIARKRVKSRLLESRSRLLEPDLKGQVQIVQREARKSRRIRPVRQLLRDAPEAIQRIKPCFMMSPLSVAQYVDPERLKFDLIVFDEASQITPADAVGSIARARQVVVVGDSKQLPPTNFFSVQVDEADDLDPDLEDTMVIQDDLESILDEVATAGVPSLRLKWHYRSEDESLIRFSNEEFYDDDPLYTFPSAERDNELLGLKFEYLAEATYDGGGVNHIEASTIADEVVSHIKSYPMLTLGVGTFGIKQQTLIQDELDVRRRKDPSIEFFFHREGERKFFVKNLENIQGDDRDVIFLSVTYGPDENGVIRRNFGPVNRKNGWRRLNVITTRAKKCLRVFSSMRGDDIKLSGGVAEGVEYLHRYLKYAESGKYPTYSVQGEHTPDSPFEREVIEALRELGYDVIPQVGEAGYRVDIGVVDPENAGRFLCGIECDGASYHSALTVRDRDRLRQQVLELRGWTIHRVWSTDWFHAPEAQMERLQALIEKTREKPRPEHGLGLQESGESGLDAAAERDESGLHTAIGAGLEAQEEQKTPIEAIPVSTYQVAEPSRVRGRDSFYEGRLDGVAAVIRKILEVEAPMHHKELARRAAGWFGMTQAGRRIRDRVARAVKLLERTGEAERRGPFVWVAGTEEPPVRRWDQDGVNNKAEYIPSEEVQAAIRLLLAHRAPLLADEIVTETARLLGFQRTGHKLASMIEDGVEILIGNGELRAGGLGIELTNKSDSEPEA